MEVKKGIIGDIKKFNLLKYPIIICLTIVLVLFCSNLDLITQKSLSSISISLNAWSNFFLIVSVFLLITSLQLKNKYIIELDYPSRSLSKGNIKLGKVMCKGHTKHRFF